jgi:mRNA interferase HigB
MHIITRTRLVDFAALHPDASPALRSWERIVKVGTFNNPQELVRIFPSASFLRDNSVVFNIGGRGKGYRLGVRMSYPRTVFIRWVLTHDEYERRCRDGAIR